MSGFVIIYKHQKVPQAKLRTVGSRQHGGLGAEPPVLHAVAVVAGAAISPLKLSYNMSRDFVILLH